MALREYEEASRLHRSRHRTRPFEPFSSWLEMRVDNMRAAHEYVSPELRNLSQLPLPVVHEHKRMWAFGNHYRTQDPVMGNSFETFDSDVGCVAATLCQASASNQRSVEANLTYVGILRRILQVNYVVTQINVMECSWIKPNVAGNPTIKQDEYGFWTFQKDAFQGPRAEPYILPVHVTQVSNFNPADVHL